LCPADSPRTLFIEHGTRRAKGNDHAQDRCVGLRAGGCRDHAQDQARHATGAAAPGSGDCNHTLAAAPERAGAALNAMNSRRFPPPLGCADHAKLSDMLAKLDEPSLTQLISDHEAGKLEEICRSGQVKGTGTEPNPRRLAERNRDNIDPYCKSGPASSIRWIALFRSWARR